MECSLSPTEDKIGITVNDFQEIVYTNPHNSLKKERKNKTSGTKVQSDILQCLSTIDCSLIVLYASYCVCVRVKWTMLLLHATDWNVVHANERFFCHLKKMQAAVYGWKRQIKRLHWRIIIQCFSIQNTKQHRQARYCCGTAEKFMYTSRNLETAKPQDHLMM